MKNAWLYAVLIWITSVLAGSFFSSLYLDLGEGDGFNTIFGSYLFIICLSGINSIPTVIIFAIGLAVFSKFNISRKKLFVIICLKSYILCFLTLYIFFFDKNDLSQNLFDPFIWIIFSFYSIGLTTGIFVFSKWFISKPSNQTSEV